MCELDEAKRMNVGNTKFISLISDGATDKSYQEAEMLYVRGAVKGIVDTKFVGIKNIKKQIRKEF